MKAFLVSATLAVLASTPALGADDVSLVGTWTGQRDRIAKRELYRLVARLGETEVEVAERVIYAVMKER